MAAKISELKVFVASPDDVKEERGSLEDIISRLNITWGATLGLRLNLIRWETNCWPGVSTDAQAHINDQIEDNYDIFIGIMWKRFGTPTPRAGSGTAEEFQRAYERHKRDPNKLRVMFYFKEAPPTSMSEIDPEQWAFVNEFRKQLGEKGVIYWEFKDSREFESLLYMHLSRQVQEWGKSWGIEKRSLIMEESTPEISPNDLIICGDISEIDNGEGFLDLIEHANESFNEGKEIAERIAQEITEFGAKIEFRSKEMDGAKTATGVDIRKARRIGDRIADDMESVVARMNIEIPYLSKSLSSGINAMSRAAVLYLDFETASEGDLISARDEALSLKTALIESMAGVRTLRNIIDATPRLTTKYNHAKKHLVAVFGSLINEMQSAINLIFEMEKVVDKAIEEIQVRKTTKK